MSPCSSAGFWLFSTAAPDGNTAAAQSNNGIGGVFVLQNGKDETVTEAVFAYQAQALMFGFTHCPDICPTGLAKIRQWIDNLDDDDQQTAIDKLNNLASDSAPSLPQRLWRLISRALI